MAGYRIAAVLALLLPALLQGQAGAETAYLEPASVYAGDIAELVIEYDNNIPSLYALDTSALSADFEVLGVRPRVSRIEQSGEIFHRMQWKIQVLPLRTGMLRIPQIRFGEHKTPELTLEVLAPTAEMRAGQDVFVETDASPANPYIGQQTRIGVRLYHNVALDYGSLSEPEADGTRVYRHRSEASYKLMRDGREFQVLERGFVLIAQQAGEVILSPAIYRGFLQSGAESTPGASRRNISRSSNALRLDVRQPPASYGGKFWLPASQLELSQQWGGNLDELRVGESLEWSLSITARGLPAESLPADLPVGDSDRFGIYADQATRSNRFDGSDLIGRLEQRFVVVATATGTIRLPDVNLTWWDVESNRERLASLEGRTLIVADGTASADTKRTGSENLYQRLRSAIGADDHRAWAILLAGLAFASALSIALVARRVEIRTWFTAHRRRHRIRARLRRACYSNDPAGARRWLIEWARVNRAAGACYSLRQVAQRAASAELAAELARLDAALFAADAEAWQGTQLWRLVRRLDRAPGRTRAGQEILLPRLYPN